MLSGLQENWDEEQYSSEEGAFRQGKTWRTRQAGRTLRKDETCKGEKYLPIVVIPCCAMNHSKT